MSEHLTLNSHLGFVASHRSADASSETAGRGGQVHQILKISEGAVHTVVVAGHDGVCLADVDRGLNGTDACAAGDTPLRIAHGTPDDPEQVRNGPRTGVSGDGAVHPLRYWVADDPTVGPYRAHVPRRRRS